MTMITAAATLRTRAIWVLVRLALRLSSSTRSSWSRTRSVTA
ncbi:hypothetical protein [Nonomuraea dietziae]